MSVVAALFGGSSQALSFNIVPAQVSGARSGAGPCATGSATTTVSGGVSPYTYSWTFVSGNTDFSATTSTASSTTFQTTLNYFGEVQIAQWQCVVTDTLGQTASDTVSVRALETSYI